MVQVAKITIDHTKVPSNLTDFPVYIKAADLPSGFWSAIHATTLGDKLIEFFRFDESSGNAVGMNGRVLTNNNSVSYGSSSTGMGNCADLGSSNSSKYLSGTIVDPDDYNTGFSLGFRIYFNQLPTGDSFDTFEFQDSGGWGGWFMRVGSGTNTDFRFGNGIGSDGGTIGVTKTWATGTWYTVVMTHSATANKVYIDGTLVATDTSNVTLANTGSLLNIGRNTVNVNYASCKYDAFGVWGKELSSTEATEFHNSGNGTQKVRAGGDIRIFKSDGTTELPREIVAIDTSNSTGEIHFKFTGTLSSSTDTEVHIYADGSSLDYLPADTYGRNNVWKSGYKAVIHAENGSLDSSGNGDWTANGSPSYSSGGIGQQVELSSSSKYLYRDNDGGLTSRTASVTMSSYQKMTNNLGNHHLMCWADYGQSFFYELRMENIGGTWNFVTNKWISSAEERVNTAYNPGTTDFHHFALRFDGNLYGYTDMTQRANFNPNDGGTSNQGKDGMTVGAVPHGSGYWQSFGGNANCAEARFFLGDLGVDWLTAEKNNLSSPSTFYTAAAAGSSNNAKFLPLLMC